MLKKLCRVIALCTTVLVLSISAAVAERANRNPLVLLNLSEGQVTALSKIYEEYSAEELKTLIEIQKRGTALRSELRRPDRFETKAKEKTSVQKADRLVRDLGKLQGQLLKTNVSYLLKAKDVLTREQRQQLISTMSNLEIDDPDESFVYSYVEIDLLKLGLNLINNQVKQILAYRSELQIKEEEIELKIAHKMLDLQMELAKTGSSDEKINTTVMEIAKLITQIIDNRVIHFLKTKDVLTTEQKKKVLNVLLLTP